MNFYVHIRGLGNDLHPSIRLGSWSRWSPWSECNDQCQRVRSRACTAPSPTNGGAFCQGLDLESSNCTSNAPHCLPNSSPSAKSSTVDRPYPKSQPLLDNDVFVYASLGCVAFLLLVIMALVALLFCRRRRYGRSAKKDNIYFPENSGKL